ncbi:MAG: hypothetical protein ACLFPF_09935 [Halanaerobiales bacterium]
MKKRLLHIFLCLVFLTIFSTVFDINVSAALSARSIGLGDDFTVIEGSEALYGNPAAVNIEGNGFVMEFNTAGEFWNNVFVNDVISDNDKDDMINIADEDGLLVASKGTFGGTMGYGPVTLFVNGRNDGLYRLSPDLARLIIRGNEVEGVYDFAGTEGATAFYSDMGINYSFQLSEETLSSIRGDNFKAENMYFGISYHYLSGGFARYNGTGGFEIGYDENNDLFLEGNDGSIVAYYTDMDDYSDAAVGHSFDLGVYSDYDERYSWGISILNIGGTMTADQMRKYEYTFEYDEANDEWVTTEPPEDGELVNEEMEYKLPLIVKFGGKMDYNDKLDFLANYTITNYGDDAFTDSYTDHKISAAAEYSGISYLPLRIGMNYSTLQSDFDISAGAGLRLGHFRMDIGVSDLTGLFYSSKGAAAGLNFRLVF